MKIAIAGCGIAGTAAGHLLAEAGHEVTLFEQAQKCEPIGAGIMLQPSGQAVLNRLGIASQVEQRSARLEGLEARLASGRRLIRLDYAMYGEGTSAWGVHRGVLFDQLLRLCHVSGVQVHTSATVTDYRIHRDQVIVITESGEVDRRFDFLIAADGSRSRLREATNLSRTTIEYQYAALWTTGPCAAVTRRLEQVVQGTGKLAGLLPIGGGRCSFFWGLRRDRYQVLLEQGLQNWKTQVRKLCPASEELLETIGSFEQLTFATYRHVRMRRWHGDRVVFLGDAAHPSSPHLGQGVNLALEDALCFSKALAESDSFHAACLQYERQRRGKLRYYQQLTRLLTPFFQSDFGLLGLGRDVVLPWFPRIGWVRRSMLQTLCGLRSGWLG